MRQCAPKRQSKRQPTKMLANRDIQHDHVFATGCRFTPRSPLPFSSRLSRYTLLEQLRDELTAHTYTPLPTRRQEIPKDGGKVRVLSIPAIRDRVVQGALKLILEPVFEADFQPGSFGYRPKRTAHDAIKRVAEAIVQRKTRVLDFDLRAYRDNVRHDRLLEKVAQRVDDADIMHLLKVMLKASGKKGVPQGGVISPLLSNL